MALFNVWETTKNYSLGQQELHSDDLATVSKLCSEPGTSFRADSQAPATSKTSTFLKFDGKAYPEVFNAWYEKFCWVASDA